MRKLITIFAMALSTFALGQTTPNLGLNIPASNTPNWGTLLNDDFSLLDSLLSGTAPLPGLSVTGPAVFPKLQTWQSGTSYSTGTIVVYMGTFYASLSSGNVGNLPTNTTFWTTSIGSGGSPLTFPSGVLFGANSTSAPTAASSSQIQTAIGSGVYDAAGAAAAAASAVSVATVPNENAVYVSTHCGSQPNCFTVKGDVQVVNDATWASAGTTITTGASDPAFACPGGTYPCSSGGDAGKIEFGTANCGTSNGFINCHLLVPQGVISSIASAHVATVSVAATGASGPSVSWFAWGTQDDSAAMQNALTQLVSLGGGDLNLPCNQMFVASAPLMVTATHQYPINVKGCASTYIIPLPNFNYASCNAAGLTTTQTGCIFSDWFTNRQVGGFLLQTPTNFDYLSKFAVWGLGQDGTSLTSRSTAIAGASLYAENVEVIGWNWNQATAPNQTACAWDVSSGYLVNDFAWSAGFCGLSVESDAVTETPTTVFGGQYNGSTGGMYVTNAAGSLTTNSTHIVSFGSDVGSSFLSGAGTSSWRSSHDYIGLVTLNATNPARAQVYLDTDFTATTQVDGLEIVEGVVFATNTSFGSTTLTGVQSFLHDNGGNFWGTVSVNSAAHIFGGYSTAGDNPTTANFTASTGWGTSGAAGIGISAVAGGIRDAYFTVTAAGTPTANPTVTYTFPVNGNAFLQAPQCFGSATGGTGAVLPVAITATSVTAITATMTGTPVPASTYSFHLHCGLNE
jgi:hypothetical protein